MLWQSTSGPQIDHPALALFSRARLERRPGLEMRSIRHQVNQVLPPSNGTQYYSSLRGTLYTGDEHQYVRRRPFRWRAGLGKIEDRGRFRRHPVRRHGIVYVSTALSSTISMPCTKLRISAFRSGNVPSWRNSRKSATYPLISLVEGNSALRCSNWPFDSPRPAVSWSWRAFRDTGCGATVHNGQPLGLKGPVEVLQAAVHAGKKGGNSTPRWRS